MKDESSARQVVAEVADLAFARGWSAVEDLAGRILSSGGGSRVLLVSGNGVDATAFRRWIEQTMDTTEIATADIDRVGLPPFPALFAEKLVAVFECRRLLEAAEVNTVVEHFLSRPLDSFAVVFMNAEQLESSEELDLVERAIWRVLVPGPPRDWRHQDLGAYRCYFWNAAAPRPFLNDRCHRDRAELAAVLRRLLGNLDRESLVRERAVRLVDFAQEQIPAPAAPTSPDWKRRRGCEDQTAELRRKIRRRLDGESASLGRQITTSLLMLEQKLLRCVEEAKGARELPTRLDQIAQSWRVDLEAELDQRAKGIASEMQQMLGEIAWGSAPAPRELTMSAANMPALRSPSAPAENQWKFAFETVATITAVSLLPVSLVSSAIGAGVFTATILRRERRRTSQISRSARQAIRDMIERAIPEMRAGVHWAVADYRNRLIFGLLESETAVAAAYTRAEPSTHTQSDRERLLSYRRRL